MLEQQHFGVQGLLYMRSIVNEYSFVIIVSIVVLFLLVAFLRFGGIWRVTTLISVCLIVLAAVYLLALNRSSTSILYGAESVSKTLPALASPSVIQFYSKY